MHKFLELSRVYGYLDVLASFCWHLLNFQRTCLPQVVFSSDLELHHYYCNTATNREPQGKQSSSSHRAQKIKHDNVYLCNTHNILWNERAGMGSSGSPTTQCEYLQPAQTIISSMLLWECLQGGWGWAHICHLPFAHGKMGTISLQQLLRNQAVNPALSIFRLQTELKYLSLHKVGCLNQFQAGGGRGT